MNHKLANKWHEELRRQLAEYKDQGNYSNTQLAQQLGTDPARVSKYLNGKLDGDVPKFEDLVRDMLKSAARRQTSDFGIFENAVTKEVDLYCEMIRKTNDVGLIHSEAGVGKSCGIQRYLANHPTAIGVFLSSWRANDKGISAAIASSIHMDGRPHATSRDEWLVHRLKNSNRPIVIDNAQRMRQSAINWIFDFHDETKVPVILVGNPGILDAIRRNDQHYSRVGIVHQVGLKGGDVKKTVEKIFAAMAPELNGSLIDEAVTVARRSGHLRTLRKQILLTLDFLASGVFDDPMDAFLAAHTKLIHGEAEG